VRENKEKVIKEKKKRREKDLDKCINIYVEGTERIKNSLI